MHIIIIFLKNTLIIHIKYNVKEILIFHEYISHFVLFDIHILCGL